MRLPAQRALLAALALLPFALSLAAGPADAQQIADDGYLRYVPLEVPRIISQTSATADMGLFGDPGAAGYLDVDPVDGIDDRRHDVLQQLAVRFAPFLVLNSELVPMDFRRVWGGPYPLRIDTWNTATGTLVHQESIDWTEGSADPCAAANRAPASADCRLLDLLREYDPRDPGYAAGQTGAKDPLLNELDVLWVDMPGNGERGWRDYWRDDSGALKTEFRGFLKSFVHPFLEEVETPDGGRGVRLVLQYWLFYPYNDGGNNHEGDWEHIHVIVSPRRFVEDEALSRDDMRRLLNGDWLQATGDDELVMKRVEYYFHSKVASLEFGMPNAYASRDEWRRQSDSLGVELNGEQRYRGFVRHLAWEDDAETRVNTHPVGYIGADNKGFDQVLSPPGGANRDSHGTYPFPGLFKNIGPAGASESIANRFDHRAYFAGEPTTVGRIDDFSRGGVVFLGSQDRVEIVPDYEQVVDLALTDPAARQAWSWLVLPVRWGFPAVASPFAGIVSNAETGNLSVIGPAFNTGWNRSGPAGQYQAYVPHVLPRMFPTDLQDAFVNDWGYFNAAVPLTVLPPFDLLWRVVAAPGRVILQDMEPTFYPRENVPPRFVGVDLGVSLNRPSGVFEELLYNPDQIDGLVATLIEVLAERGADSTTMTTGSHKAMQAVAAPLFRIQLFLGNKFATTNSLVNFRSRLEDRAEFNNIDDVSLAADLNWWEYTGSLRYNVLAKTLTPYLKVGYGLSWYRFENTTVGGELIDEPTSAWVRKPGFFENLLPNTWHFGAGLELLAIKGEGALPGGLDVGLSAEWLRFTNRLGVNTAGVAVQQLVLLGLDPAEFPRDRWIGRSAFNLTATISY